MSITSPTSVGTSGINEMDPTKNTPSSESQTIENAAQNASVQSEKKMWQIFTDDTGEVQRKSVKIVENPFEAMENAGSNPFIDVSSKEEQRGNSSNDQLMPNGIANPNAYNGSSPPKLNINGSDNRPAKPMRNARNSANQTSTGYKKKHSMNEDTVVFEADTTYTRFDNVDCHPDDDDDDEVQISSKEQHYTGKKFLIRSESDLDLVLPGAGSPSLATRLQWCCAGYERWPRWKTFVKISVVGFLMCLAYGLIVLCIVKVFG